MFEGDIWECACGDGAMATRLMRTGNRVIGSDLYDRGFGETGLDFLTSDRICDNIVTNPPYNSAEGFVARGLRNSRKKLAFVAACLPRGGQPVSHDLPTYATKPRACVL